MIYVPELVPQGQFAQYVADRGYQQALETGLDRAAIMMGMAICGYNENMMFTAQLAITKRVYRDVVEQRRLPLDEGFLARLEAELDLHRPRSVPLRKEIVEVRDAIHKAMQEELTPRGVFDIYEAMVASYAVVYSKTTVQSRESGILGEAQD